MVIRNKLLIIGLLASFGVACTTTSETSSDAGGQQDASTDSRDTAQDQGAINSNPFDDPSNPLSQRVVYFGFDSDSIKPGDRDIIIAHAQYLSANSSEKVVLEGHADERGTREYNIALGERRANAVRQLMTLQGVASSQIDVVSFGEERPIAIGHDESAWGQNRRVEILYPSH